MGPGQLNFVAVAGVPEAVAAAIAAGVLSTVPAAAAAVVVAGRSEGIAGKKERNYC